MVRKPALRILLVDDEEIIHETIGEYLTESGAEVSSLHDGISAVEDVECTDYDLMLVDVRMPGMDGFSLLKRVQQMRPEMSVVIITGLGSMETAIQALRMGAADFLPKPIKLLELDAVVEKALRVRSLRREKRHLRETIGGLQKADGLREGNRVLVGVSRATEALREQIRRVVEAGCDAIMIEGETGTGKEVVAREIHFQATSEQSPFIAVSCPALPESLVEAELFGHTKGAFTGAATDRPGYFEMADGGTLFWMRWEIYLRRHRPSCCECSRRGVSAASAAPRRSPWTFAWLRPPIDRWRTSCSRGPFVPICCIV